MWYYWFSEMYLDSLWNKLSCEYTRQIFWGFVWNHKIQGYRQNWDCL